MKDDGSEGAGKLQPVAFQCFHPVSNGTSRQSIAMNPQHIAHTAVCLSPPLVIPRPLYYLFIYNPWLYELIPDVSSSLQSSRTTFFVAALAVRN